MRKMKSSSEKCTEFCWRYGALVVSVPCSGTAPRRSRSWIRAHPLGSQLEFEFEFEFAVGAAVLRCCKCIPVVQPCGSALLQVEVMEGCLKCPESGREFPISRGIPNMLLNEDEA